MPDYPRACPKCGIPTAKEGFAVDRHAAAGRKSHCKACDRKRRKGYYAAHKDEWNAQRRAAREAAWEAELEALEVEHRKKVGGREEAGRGRSQAPAGVPALDRRPRLEPGRDQRESPPPVGPRGAGGLGAYVSTRVARRAALPQAFRLLLQPLYKPPQRSYILPPHCSSPSVPGPPIPPSGLFLETKHVLLRRSEDRARFVDVGCDGCKLG
jgi:hypothetical protein